MVMDMKTKGIVRKRGRRSLPQSPLSKRGKVDQSLLNNDDDGFSDALITARNGRGKANAQPLHHKAQIKPQIFSSLYGLLFLGH